MQQKTRNLYSALSSKAKSDTHLETPRLFQFIKLCSEHQSRIIKQFGVSKVCQQPCMMCQRCHKHHAEDPKHEYLGVKQFLKLVCKIKLKYQQYHRLYVKEMIPEFLKNLVDVIMGFIKGLETWNEETVLVSNFLPFSRNKKIQQLLTSKMIDWNLERFNCHDIFEMKYIAQRMETDQLKQNILDDIQGLLSRVLITSALIPPKQDKDLKRQQIIQGDAFSLSNRIKQLEQKLPKLRKLGLTPKTNLVVNLTQEMLPIHQAPQNNNNNLIIEQIIQEKQQQQNSKLAQMLDSLFSLLRKTKTQNIYFTSKITSKYKDFWDQLIDKFIELAIDKDISVDGGVRSVVIYSLMPSQVQYIFEEAFRKYEEQNSQLLSKIKVQIQQQASNKNNKTIENKQQKNISQKGAIQKPNKVKEQEGQTNVAKSTNFANVCFRFQGIEPKTKNKTYI